LPEFPDWAELPLLEALPVFPELALPDVAVVVAVADDPAFPLWPPSAEPHAVLGPEFPVTATGWALPEP
jgi:hypothetical protein